MLSMQGQADLKARIRAQITEYMAEGAEMKAESDAQLAELQATIERLDAELDEVIEDDPSDVVAGGI